jgi:hypothetical protein
LKASIPAHQMPEVMAVWEPNARGDGRLGADGQTSWKASRSRTSSPWRRETPRDPRSELEALQAVFALAHPARRQILLTVYFRGEMSAGQIAGRFAHAWPTTTRHLRVLESAGPGREHGTALGRT